MEGPRFRASADYSFCLTLKKALVMIALTANKRFSVKALSNGKTIDGKAYLDFVKSTGDKWRCLRSRPVLLHWQHGNARPHVKTEVSEYFTRRQVTMIRQSPYSPDLNILDRWVNEQLKKDLRLKRFTSAEEVEKEVVRVLNHIDEARYRREVDLLMAHCVNVINSKGHYVTSSHS